MLTREQEEIIMGKVRMVVEAFSKTSGNISEISKMTNIPTSSVQRYLNSERVGQLFGPEIADGIKKKLEENLHNAKVKGGRTYATNNIAEKDELGKFTGSRKR